MKRRRVFHGNKEKEAPLRLRDSHRGAFITPIAPWLGAVSFSLWGFVHDATGSYNAMFIIGVVLCLLTSLFGMLSKASSKVLADKREMIEVETMI